MSILAKIPAAVASRNFGYGDIPFRSQCLAAHLFGIDQATSVANLAGGAALEVPGAAPTYAAHSALFGPGSYFRTPFAGDSRNRFCAVVSSYAYTDSVYDAYDGVVRFPPVYAPGTFQNGIGARGPLTWNDGTQFFDLGVSGPWFRAGDADISSSTVGKLNYAFPTMPIADTDGTWQDYPSVIGVGSGPANCDLYLPNQRIMRAYSLAQSGAAPAASKTVLGNIGAAATGKVRMHSYFEWTYLNPAQAAIALTYVGALAAADGYRTGLYFEDLAVLL